MCSLRTASITETGSGLSTILSVGRPKSGSSSFSKRRVIMECAEPQAMRLILESSLNRSQTFCMSWKMALSTYSRSWNSSIISVSGSSRDIAIRDLSTSPNRVSVPAGAKPCLSRSSWMSRQRRGWLTRDTKM